MSVNRWSTLACALVLMMALAPANAFANNGKQPAETPASKEQACEVLKGLVANNSPAANRGLANAVIRVCGEDDDDPAF